MELPSFEVVLLSAIGLAVGFTVGVRLAAGDDCEDGWVGLDNSAVSSEHK